MIPPGNHRSHILYEMDKILRCKIACIVKYDDLKKLKNVKWRLFGTS